MIKFVLTPNMRATLEAMKGGKAMTHEAIAAITKRDKGNRLRELTGAKFVLTHEQEGVRGYVYTITPEGRKALAEPVEVKPKPDVKQKAEVKVEAPAPEAKPAKKVKESAKPKGKKPKTEAK